MKTFFFNFIASCFFLLLARPLFASSFLREEVFVETNLDSDEDGKNDFIYVRISRVSSEEKLPAIYSVNPYSDIREDVDFHNVDVLFMPQDVLIRRDLGMDFFGRKKSQKRLGIQKALISNAQYANIEAHSLGTGRSDGCPTIGDEKEALAAKAVIDWLNGRALAYDSKRNLVRADWSNGLVGMTGVSYLGTLPNMIASLGVEELKAIVPIAAISSWYDYYRANGLVVGPGGYVGEDVDILAKFISQRPKCKTKMQELTANMGRLHGDYTDFWKSRDMRIHAEKVKTAVFVIHGQSDWNVKQSQAIEWWKVLQDIVPTKLWLHREGHSDADNIDQDQAILRWFDRYVKNDEGNGVDQEPKIMVQEKNGVWKSQNSWPHEETHPFILYPHGVGSLESMPPEESAELVLIDQGRKETLESMLEKNLHPSLLKFQTKAFTSAYVFSGTTYVHLELALKNRHAANISVALVDIDQKGRKKVVTRGWMDPQNYDSLEHGKIFNREEFVKLKFKLEPKQFSMQEGHRLAVVLYSTDYEYTIRPEVGTEIMFKLGRNTFFEFNRL